MNEIKIGNLACDCIPFSGCSKVSYVVYPAVLPLKDSFLQGLAQRHNTNIVVIYIPADGWNDMLTPWPEPGETPDSPPFGGNAQSTLDLITSDVVPSTDKILGIGENAERIMIGVSLSGLFALWQWLRCPIFNSIACLSGSFWYNGFLQWFYKQSIPAKTGKAFFLLGKKEPHAWIKAYRSVGVNTEAIVDRLRASNIDTEFIWVQGDHFADPEGRLEQGFSGLL